MNTRESARETERRKDRVHCAKTYIKDGRKKKKEGNEHSNGYLGEKHVNPDTKPELAVDQLYPSRLDEDISGKVSCPRRNALDLQDAVQSPKP